MSDDGICLKCHWFESVKSKHDLEACGYCHRYPPSFDSIVAWDEVANESGTSTEVSARTYAWVHPKVNTDDWCGEFKDKWRIQEKVD